MTLMTKHLNCQILGLVATLSDAYCQTEKVFKRIRTLACSAIQLNTSRRKDIHIQTETCGAAVTHNTAKHIQGRSQKKIYN